MHFLLRSYLQIGRDAEINLLRNAPYRNLFEKQTFSASNETPPNIFYQKLESSCPQTTTEAAKCHVETILQDIFQDRFVILAYKSFENDFIRDVNDNDKRAEPTEVNDAIAAVEKLNSSNSTVVFSHS